MEERHDQHRSIRLRQLVGGHNIAQAGHQVAVAERDALGPAGGAAGVQEQGDITFMRGVTQLLRPTRPHCEPFTLCRQHGLETTCRQQSDNCSHTRRKHTFLLIVCAVACYPCNAQA